MDSGHGPKEPRIRSGGSRSIWVGAILRVKGRPIVKHMDSAISCVKTAEPIEMPFGLWTPVGPRKHVSDGGAHWRHLANTIELSTCGTMWPPFVKLV